MGGLSAHIAAMKEMVVFPLLYPEVFEALRIQPPRLPPDLLPHYTHLSSHTLCLDKLRLDRF